MPRRIGILGGTFDPVHIGHLVAAVCARDQLALDVVLLLPNNRSPLKSGGPFTSFADRVAMLRLAIDQVPGLVVSEIEGERGEVSYTVDTLDALEGEYKGDELVLILGNDTLSEFESWKATEQITARARIAGLARDGDDRASVRYATDLVRMPRLDVSSTLLRDRIAAGASIEFLTPVSVARYIAERRLYHA